MKKIFLTFLFTGFIFLSASAQFFSWVKAGINKSTNSNINIASEKNLIATTSLGVAPSNQIPPPYHLMVNDTSSSLMWGKKITTSIFIPPAYNSTPAVALDKNQNIILAGNFHGTLFIDNNTILTTPATNGGPMYLVKFNSNGVQLWSRSSLFAMNQYISSVNTSADSVGNIYVTGCFRNTLTIGSLSVTSTGLGDAFIAKYDPNGNLLWLKKAGTVNEETQIISKVAPNGFLYLALTDLGTQPTKQTLLKLDTNGTTLWNKTIMPAGNSSVKLAIDNANNLYLTGNYSGSIDFTNATSLTAILNYKTFLAKFNSNGVFKWAKDLATGNNFTSGVPAIYYSSANQIIITGYFNGSAIFGNTIYNSSPNNSRNSYVVKTDTAGTLIWTKTIPSATGGENEATGVTGDEYGNFYISGSLSGNANFSGAVQNSVSRQDFLAKINKTGGNLVSGTVFLDKNLNGIKDANETGVVSAPIGTTTNLISNITDLNGAYNLLLPSGNFTLVPAAKKHYTFAPATHTLNFSGVNQELTNRNFALQPIPNQTDVKITLTNLAAARPGFHFAYFLTFENVGTNVVSDTLSFKYDPVLLTYQSSSNQPNSNQGGTLKWFYQNLQPNEKRTIEVHFLISTVAPLNSVLTASSYVNPITTDLFPADNYDSTQIVISGSYDPNDKQVDKLRISSAAASQGEFLDYTIRFQNTGTDTAFTVAISDKISANLQLNTFEMLSASHPFTVSLKNGNLLEWRFENILLPDSNRNEPASHGFLRFRIKNKAGILQGDSITNQAAIYFDYNAPVITNYAVTKVANPTGIQENKANVQAFKLYPNPAKNYVMVEANFKKNTTATVSLVNHLGQTISKVNLPANNQIHYQLQLNELPKGVYLIKLETESGLQTKRLVIQ